MRERWLRLLGAVDWFGRRAAGKRELIVKAAERDAYRTLLGREPDESTPRESSRARDTRLALIGNLLRSEEFILGHAAALPDVIMTSPEDLAVFRQFGRYNGPPARGFVTDFLGNRTDINFVRGIESLDGAIEGYPLPRGNFHGDPTEWIATLLSVLAAGETFTAVELGAGWAPWLVSCARACAMRGVKSTRFIGVEGSSAHAEMMRQHFKNNGFSTECHMLLHAVVGATDGYAQFPIASDPAADWGQAAITGPDASATHDYRGHKIEATERVRMRSLASLLSNESAVDLMHIDVQGAELEIVTSGIETLNGKVKCLVIGTHSRVIEGKMTELLSSHGWILCREQACRIAQAESRVIHCIADGCQMWRNPVWFK
jgi:FkbM family methyltransferase